MKTRTLLVRLIVLLWCVAAAARAYAQTDPPRFEVGGQLATLRLSDFDRTNAGFGGRISYDLTRWLAAEGEMNLFGNEYVETRLAPVTIADARLGYSRRRVDGFFGSKVGWRGERIGVFGKVRPGFTRLYDKGIQCVGEACARMLILLARPEYRTEFALDLGGVVEFYPTPRTVTRLDLGSTIIHHRSAAPPCRDCTTRNFASRVGAGFRF